MGGLSPIPGSINQTNKQNTLERFVCFPPLKTIWCLSILRGDGLHSRPYIKLEGGDESSKRMRARTKPRATAAKGGYYCVDGDAFQTPWERSSASVLHGHCWILKWKGEDIFLLFASIPWLFPNLSMQTWNRGRNSSEVQISPSGSTRLSVLLTVCMFMSFLHTLFLCRRGWRGKVRKKGFLPVIWEMFPGSQNSSQRSVQVKN